MQVNTTNTTAASGTNSATNSASTSSSTSSSSAAGATNTLNYNSFLQLLVAQLKNQSPTNPADPSQFVSQLASFSQVEQQVNTNSKLDALLTQTQLAEAGSVIGKTVTSSDGTVSGQIASVQLTSSGATATLADGKTLTLGSGVTFS
jgi:flagellar basal-body rod modification protein FlgD